MAHVAFKAVIKQHFLRQGMEGAQNLKSRVNYIKYTIGLALLVCFPRHPCNPRKQGVFVRPGSAGGMVVHIQHARVGVALG